MLKIFLLTLTYSFTVAPCDGAVVMFTGGGYVGWQQWNWTTITHLGFWTKPSDEVRAKAKANGVKLFEDAHLPAHEYWSDPANRTYYAQKAASKVKEDNLDGVFFDYEGQLSSDQQSAYVKLAQAFQAALKPLNATIFVCVGGRPSYEFRDYDYSGLAAASEFLFIMAYDMHFWDDYTCILIGTCSPAEAPIKDVAAGVSEYVNKSKVDPQKLVLGLPWYGILYLPVVLPFNEGEIVYRDILKVIDDGKTTGKPTLQKDAMAWKIECKGSCVDGKKGTEIWYDDAETLAPKYALAARAKFLGVGAFCVDDLPPANGTDKHSAEREAMWHAIDNWNILQ